MNEKERIHQVVYRILDVVNQRLPAEERIEKSPAAVLLGPGGSLDSLGLVDLVMEVQQAMFEEFGVPVAVVNDQLLLTTSSPFRTVGSFIDHLEKALAHEQRS